MSIALNKRDEIETRLANLDGPSIENSKRPFPLDSDEEVSQKVGKFMKNSNKSLRKTSVESQGKDIYEDCSQSVAEISTEAKDDLINDSNETGKNQAAQREGIREKDLEKVIKTHESKIPVSIKTKSLLHGYPLPPGYNAKELQEKFSKHPDTRHAVSGSNSVLETKTNETRLPQKNPNISR